LLAALCWVGAGHAWTPASYWLVAGMVLLLGLAAGFRGVQLDADELAAGCHALMDYAAASGG
jgi:hypothetical protein